MSLKVAGIEYEVAGEGPLVVFLHGIGGDTTSFTHQMDLPGYRSVAWNMPGYLGSDPLGVPFTFERLSDALGNFIDALGGPVHLVGQSIGGMVALEHACRRPDQLISLGLVATTSRFGGRDDSFKKEFLKARLAPLEAGLSMAEMAREAAPGLVARDCPAEEVARIETALSRVPEAVWRDILECLVTFDRYANLTNLAMPVLAVAGSEDLNAPARTVDKMAGAIDGAVYHLMDGAGHMLHQEMPEEFNKILLAHLARAGGCK